MTLAQLLEEIQDCKKCALRDSATNFVFGTGSEKADILFIGEAPGFHEDKQGIPFVGAAGQLLDRLLLSISLTRSDVYIANILKCRPPENRDPLPEEIEACTPHLRRQIEIIDPLIICTLGNFATKFILETTEGISKIRGKRFPKDGRIVVPIFHPAAALHQPANRQALFDDFLELKTIIETSERPAHEPVQATLF